MKKFITLLLISSLGTLVYGQAIVDNATIPVSITLNTILRLNVTAGGNIDFAVNTLNQYEYGIANTPNHTTEFTIASSIDYDVELYAEDASFIGSDLTGSGISGAGTNNLFPLEMVGYVVDYTGTGHSVGLAAGTDDISLAGLGADPSALQLLTNAPFEIISSVPGAGHGGAGDITVNRFQIQWELGTNAVVTHASHSTNNTLLNLGLPSDRYSTNVFVSLKAHD